MKEITVAATEIKNNFGKYLDIVTDPLNQTEVIITKNGKPVARFQGMTSNPAAALSGMLAYKTEGDMKYEQTEE